MEDASTAFEFGYIIGLVIGTLLVFGLPVLFVISLIRAFVKKSKGWIVTAIITGALSLTLLGVGIYFAMNGIMDEVRRSNKPHVFQTSDDLASLTGPGGWKKLKLGSPETTLEVGNLRKEEYLMVIPEPRTNFDEGFTCKDFAQLAAKVNADEVKDAKMTEPSPLTINGFPAFQLQISGKVEGLDIEYLNTYLQGKEHFYQILTWTLSSKREIAFPRFKKAVGSFHELPPKTVP